MTTACSHFSRHGIKTFTAVYDRQNNVCGKTSYYGIGSDQVISNILARGYYVKINTYDRNTFYIKPTGPVPEYVVNDHDPVSYTVFYTGRDDGPGEAVFENKFTIMVDVEYCSRVPAVGAVVVTLANGQEIVVHSPTMNNYGGRYVV